MNIDLIKNYPTGALSKHKYGNSLEQRKKKSADLCEENKNVNRGYYGGSFTGITNGAAAGVRKATEAIPVKDTLFDKVLKLCDKHTVIAQNLVALILATTLRPLAIMSLPGKNKEDKTYASGHAIASGLIGFGFSSIVMYPLGQAAKKAKEIAKNPEFLIKDAEKGSKSVAEKMKKIYSVNSLEELAHSKAFKNVTRILDMAPDVFLFGVLKAVLTVKLIKPILKYVFGLEKKPAAKPAQPNPEAANLAAKNEIGRFVGGLK